LRGALLVFLLAGMVAFVGVGYWRWVQERDEIQAQLDTQARFAAVTTQSLLRQWGRGLALSSASPAALEPRFRRLLQTYPRVAGVRAYGPDGAVVAELRRDGRFTAKAQPARAVPAALNRGGGAVTAGLGIAPSRSCAPQGGGCLPVRRRVDPGAGGSVRVLEALVPVANLAPLWRRLQLPDDARLGLVRADGRLQARWPEPRAQAAYGTPIGGPLAGRLQDAPDRGHGRFTGPAPTGAGARLGAFSRLPEVGLTAYVSRPQGAVWQAWWDHSWPLLGSFGLYLGLLGGLSHMVSRRERDHRGELHSLSRIDPLTGLPNRMGFNEALSEAAARTRRRNGAMALLLLDLDDFKEVNDRFGHAVGDELLQAVAQRLGQQMRSGDVLARRTGDEFGLLLADVDAEAAAAIAARMLDAFDQPLSVAGTSLRLSLSIGIATRTEPGEENELQQQADSAVEAAKAQGGGQYVFFAQEMGEAIQRKLALKQEVARAWEQAEFCLYFQPLYRLWDHALVGAEALMRWQDPEQGTRSPAEFIPLVEETGLIVSMGYWAMREGCREVSHWQWDGAPLRLSLNVSPRQMQDPGFVRQVDEVLRETGLPPEQLVLEVTESIAMTVEEEGSRMLHELRELGVAIAMDDFGTGYSSLSYLENLPLDLLKIDRSFVNRLHQTETRTIAQVIVDLADTLGLECLAEGIETPEQEAILRELGCELGQGFHRGHPVPAARFRSEFL